MFFICFLLYPVGHSYKYDVTFQTGTRANAGTEANVTIKLFNGRGLNSTVKLPLKTYRRGRQVKKLFLIICIMEVDLNCLRKSTRNFQITQKSAAIFKKGLYLNLKYH